MTIGLLPEGTKPRVEIHPSGILIWAGIGDEEQVGLIMSTGAAIDTGLAAIAHATRIDGHAVVLHKADFEISLASPQNEDCAALFTFGAEGARFSIELSTTQLLEIAAAFAATAKEIG